MKICPKCQQQYPNGFQYCPNDTEALITNEEHIRRTKPLSAVQAPQRTEAPAVEFVPITNPFPNEKTEPFAGAKSTNIGTANIGTANIGTEGLGPEKPANPFRKTEAPRLPQEAPKKPQGTAQAPVQSLAKEATLQQLGSGGIGNAQSAFSFSIPEEPGLLSRLSAGLQNIGEIFKKSDYKTSDDFQFLLQEESLGTRVMREVGSAWTEFRRDPRKFAVEFVRGEGTNLHRRNALIAGSEMALVGYLTFYLIGLAVGMVKKPNGMLWNTLAIAAISYLSVCYLIRGALLLRLINRVNNKLVTSKLALEVFNWTPVMAAFLLAIFLGNYNFYCRFFPGRCELPEEQIIEPLLDVTMIDTSKIDVKLPESAKAKEKMIGGSKSQPKPASGGGGGGRNEPTPPSKGVPPQMALTPQIIPPDPNPPKIKNPTLVVASTIYGDPKAMPPMKGPIGDPDGIPAPPSSGPGTGDGIGRGTGTGVGRGGGGGAGPGQGGNTGGGNMGIGGGRSVEPMTASLRPTILYRERAKYTEEARANKIQGAVVLQLVYTADGRITDIKVVRGLPDGLTESAIESAKKIRFQPAVKNGQPVSVRGNVEFNFTLY